MLGLAECRELDLRKPELRNGLTRVRSYARGLTDQCRREIMMKLTNRALRRARAG